MNFRDMTWRSSSRTASALMVAKVVSISRFTKVFGDEIALAETMGRLGGLAMLEMAGAKLSRAQDAVCRCLSLMCFAAEDM